jgi:hypothetical protein
MRPINQIAQDIRKEWKNVNYAAKPYLEAMYELTDKNSRYGYDSANSIVLRFLSNAASFRGPVAAQLKNELKQHIK